PLCDRSTLSFPTRRSSDLKLDFAIDPDADRGFEYFGLRTVYDRYLLRHPSSRLVTETPQYFLMRVACGLSRTPAEAIEFHRLMSDRKSTRLNSSHVSISYA